MTATPSVEHRQTKTFSLRLIVGVAHRSYYRTTAGTRQAHTSSLPQQEGIKTQQLPPEKGSPQEPQTLPRRGEFTLVKNPIFSSNKRSAEKKTFGEAGAGHFEADFADVREEPRI